MGGEPGRNESTKAWRGAKPPSQMSRTAVLVEGAMMVALGFVLSLIPFFHLPWGGSVTCFSTLPIIVMSFRHGLKWGVSTAAVFGVVQALMGANSVAAAGSFGAMLLCALLDYFLAYAAVGLSGPIARLFMRAGASAAGPSASTGPSVSTGSSASTGSAASAYPVGSVTAGASAANASGVGVSDAGGSAAPQKAPGFLRPTAALAAGVVITGLMRLLCSFLSGVLIWGAWAPEGVPVWQYSLTYNAGWCLPDVAIVLIAAVALSMAPGLRMLSLPE